MRYMDYFADREQNIRSSGLPVTGQSPINLDDRLVRERKYPPLVLNGHWLNEGEAKMINNGQTAKITLSGNRIPSTICGGPLVDDVYEFESAHFHWGEDNCNGAEHTINNTWYSMEGHVIHWNRKYHTMEECFRHKDGFCILAYLFLVQPGCCNCINPQLERITENLKDIVDTEMETKIPPNSLAWMRWATYCSRYYTYSGSFNVADYPECATWIVFPVVIPVRASEVSCNTATCDRDAVINQRYRSTDTRISKTEGQRWEMYKVKLSRDTVTKV
ncbi:carbonic anhydrase 3 isoform X1 [Apis mellifera carnica]|uniref:Carbonic anhydrase 3 isoform X1 n=1 Tax=Apis mellifera TaxID=7460 RepID=A0A7M7MUV2_APIME|nr:carbonic anhydrase 3 isoform X1 [Apis mellifera]KAG9428457.1 carbonic anhydrase 3 isoform X1 [Apis mellifera carnica]|eukprot:XP_026301328.1 carbonic anhydrase 3 isoform X1 [Apis mellifera]